jgi:hypothetical protein
VFGVSRVGVSLSDCLVSHSISIADIINSESAVSVDRIVGVLVFAVAFEIVGNGSLGIPDAKELTDVDVGDCFWNILLEVDLGLGGSQHVAGQEGQNHTSDNGSSFVHRFNLCRTIRNRTDI